MFAGQDVTVRLEATSAGTVGAIADFDQLCISATGDCAPTPTRTATSATVTPTPKPPSVGAARKCRAALVAGVTTLVQEEARRSAPAPPRW